MSLLAWFWAVVLTLAVLTGALWLGVYWGIQVGFERGREYERRRSDQRAHRARERKASDESRKGLADIRRFR